MPPFRERSIAPSGDESFSRSYLIREDSASSASSPGVGGGDLCRRVLGMRRPVDRLRHLQVREALGRVHRAVEVVAVAEVLVHMRPELRTEVADEPRHHRRVVHLRAASGPEERAHRRDRRHHIAASPRPGRAEPELGEAGRERHLAALCFRDVGVYSGDVSVEDLQEVLAVLAVLLRQAGGHRLELRVRVAVEPRDLSVGEPSRRGPQELERLGATERAQELHDREPVLGGHVAGAECHVHVGIAVDVRLAPLGVAVHGHTRAR